MAQRTWVLKGSNATSQTTVATSAATGTDYPQVGDIVFVGVGHDNSGAAVPTLSSLAVSGAGAVDSWRIKSQGTANVATAAGAVQGDLAWGIVTTAFTSATVITATLSAAVTAKTIGVGAFIGAGLVSGSATGGTSDVTQMSANSGLGFTIGVAATEASTPLTTNTGTTLLTNTGGSGGSAAQVSISMVYDEAGGGITTAAPSDGGFSWFGFKTLITANLSGNAIPSGEAFGDPTITGGGGVAALAAPWVGAAVPGNAAGTAGTSVTVDVSGCPTGQVCFIFGTIADAQLVDITHATWNILGQQAEGTSGGSSSRSIILWKVKNSGDTTVTITWGVSQKYEFVPVSWPGVEATTPTEGLAWLAHTNGTSYGTPSVTPSAADRWAVGLFSARGTTATAAWTPDAALTERVDAVTSASVFTGLEVADSNAPVTAASHSYTATSQTASHGLGGLFYLIPSSGGGGGATTLSPTAIGSGEAFGTPSASTPLTVSPTGISSAEGFGTPVVATPIVASPSGIASAEAFGSPTIAQTLTVSPTAIGSGEAFGTPVIPAVGIHNINPPGDTWWTTSFNNWTDISVANPFYTTDSGWSLTGARVYFNSAMITALGAGNSVSVFVMGDTGSGVINTLAQLTDGLVTVPSSAGWASVTFSSPISMTANTRYWVGYHTTGEYEAYNYSNTGTLYQATDGSNLFMGRPVAQTTWDVSEYEYRSSNYIAAPTTGNFWWGIDIIAGSPSGGTTTISPSGVTSAEAFGTASISEQLTASPSAIPTAEVFGTLSVTSILTAIAQGIASGELFGNPSNGAQISISPVGISSAEAFGTLSVSAALTVSPTGGVSAESFGTVNVTLVLSVNPSGVPPGEAFGTPVITTGGGPTTVSPTGIVSVEAFGTLTYSGTRTVSPVGVGSLEAFGTPVITSGGVVLSPTAISTAESFGTPSITKTLTVSPTGIAGPGGVPFTTYIKNTYSPKLEWMMDETSGTVATDSSGNAKDGTITGSPTLGAAGIINDGGTGILFDGVNGKYIVGPLENTLSLNQWTVIAFAKTSSTVEQTLAQRSGTGNGRFQIKNSWGTADGKMYVQNDENLAFVATPASVADGTGRMLAFRQDATTLKIFQNGGTQLASVASAAANTNVQNGTLYVGANNAGLKVWNGTLDGFIVVAGALTTTQLDDIYAASQAAAASQFGTLTITQVLNVLTNGIPTDEGFGIPSVSTQLISSPTGIASTEAFGTPALSFAVTYSPIGIASAEGVSPVVVTAGGIVLSPISIVSAQAIGVPSITQSIPLSPSGIPSGETFGTVVITKTLTVLPSGINSSLAFGTLTATISPDIRPTPIPSAEAFGTPVIGGGIPTTVGTAYTAGVGIEVGVYLSGHPQLIWPAPTPPVTQAALPDPTVAPTLSASDTSGGALPDGTYRYSYAAWRGTVAQCTKPSPTADISITVNDTVTLTYPTIPGADGYIVYREKIA